MIHYAVKSAIHRKHCWMTQMQFSFITERSLICKKVLMEKRILFIVAFIKPNNDNSLILEDSISHKKSITSFFSLNLSPNPPLFIMIVLLNFLWLLFSSTKKSQKFVFIYWHSITNAVIHLATVLPICPLIYRMIDLYHHAQIKMSLLWC